MLPQLRRNPGLLGDLLESFFADTHNDFDFDFLPVRKSEATYDFDEKTREHNITVQAPGFKKEDIKIEVDNQGISLSGEIKDESIKGRVSQQKFSYFLRKPGINDDTVDAKLEDGILSVKFKTEKEKKTSKTIEIK